MTLTSGTESCLRESTVAEGTFTKRISSRFRSISIILDFFFILSEFVFYRSGIKRNCDEIEYKFLHNEVKIIAKIVHRCPFKKPAKALRIVRVKMRVWICSINDAAAQVAKVGLTRMKVIRRGKVFNIPRKCRKPSCCSHQT